MFQYTLAGAGELRWSGRRFEVGPGHGFMCRVGDPRAEYLYSSAHGEPWDFMWLSFAGGNASELVDGLLERHGPLYALPLATPALRTLLTFRRRPVVRLDAFRAARLVLELLEALDRSTRGVRLNAAEYVVQRAERLIARRAGEAVDVSTVARELGVSREHLSRAFRAVRGESPRELIARVRMVRACALLKSGKLSVKQVSARVGLPNASNFARAFRRYTGFTPVEFQRSRLT